MLSNEPQNIIEPTFCCIKIICIFASMTKDEILLFVYNSSNIKASAKRITKGDDLYNDLLSELLLIIDKMGMEQLTSLYQNQELEIYCYKIMYYQYTQPHMPFYKKYRGVETSEGVVYEDESIDQCYSEVVDIMNKIEKQIARKRYPTEIRLLELYIKHGTYRAVSKELGISFKTIQNHVKTVIEKIRKEYDISYNS